jgi:type IV pilus assembly protein PilE
MKKPCSGFTLIELMITVAIVGILASVALPSYRNHVIRGNRSAAQAQLMDLANREQQYLLAQRSYTSTLGTGGLGVTIDSNVSKYYTVSISLTCATTSTPCFEISATPITTGMQKNDGALLIDSSGNKKRGGDPAKWDR